MPLDILVIAGDVPVNRAKFEVAGMEFNRGFLQFALGTWNLSATVTPRGTISEVRTNGYVHPGATMVRMSTAQR